MCVWINVTCVCMCVYERVFTCVRECVFTCVCACMALGGLTVRTICLSQSSHTDVCVLCIMYVCVCVCVCVCVRAGCVLLLYFNYFF